MWKRLWVVYIYTRMNRALCVWVRLNPYMYVCMRKRKSCMPCWLLWWHRKWWCNSIQSQSFFSHAHCLPLCVSHTIMYLPLGHRDIPSPTIMWARWLWSRSLSQTHTDTFMEHAGWELRNLLKCKTGFRRIHTADLWPWTDSLCLFTTQSFDVSSNQRNMMRKVPD